MPTSDTIPLKRSVRLTQKQGHLNSELTEAAGSQLWGGLGLTHPHTCFMLLFYGVGTSSRYQLIFLGIFMYFSASSRFVP